MRNNLRHRTFLYLFSINFLSGYRGDFDEAAVVDGAVPAMIYRRIIVSLPCPVLSEMVYTI
ncbi:MAG: hypothetical protein GXP33_12280 [Spirochaetes bacterium]|nr:hypothetical protein [Spirochaetota bacterium]